MGLPKIDTELPRLTEILAPYQDLIGEAYDGYRNHCARMLHCAFALHDCDEEDHEKLTIAAAFHDIGLWTANTVDYIEPSVPPAMEYLKAEGREAWGDEIRLMITEHHKVRTYKGDESPLIELMRKADLVDFSKGLVKHGLPGAYIRALKAAFPNAGFHSMLMKRAGAWFLRHPLNPAPMMKW